DRAAVHPGLAARPRVHRHHQRAQRTARPRDACSGRTRGRRRRALDVRPCSLPPRLRVYDRAPAHPRSQDPVAGRPLDRVGMSGRRDWTRETLAAGIREGDRRALARAITLVENQDPLAYQVVADVYPETGNAYAVGVTGPPGVGKSSLISALVRVGRAD